MKADERMVLSPQEIKAILHGSLIAVNITKGSPLSDSLLSEMANNAAMALCCGRRMALLEDD